MSRRGMASHVALNTRNGPLNEFATETWQQWLTRQNNPVKANAPRHQAPKTTAVKDAAITAFITRNKKAADELALDDRVNHNP